VLRAPSPPRGSIHSSTSSISITGASPYFCSTLLHFARATAALLASLMKQTPACSCVSSFNSCPRQGFPQRIIITNQRISAAQHWDPRPSNRDPGPVKRERGNGGGHGLSFVSLAHVARASVRAWPSQIVPITLVPFSPRQDRARPGQGPGCKLNFDVWPCCTNHWAAAVRLGPALLTFFVASIFISSN
ncbi:hypothetical protein CI102_1623, partial [Trichoderma harzianum]